MSALMSPNVLEQIFVNFKYLCTLRQAFEWKIIVARRLSLKDFISVRYHALKSRRKSERSSRLIIVNCVTGLFGRTRLIKCSRRVLQIHPSQPKLKAFCRLKLRRARPRVVAWMGLHKKCVSMKIFRETWLNDNHGLRNSHRDGFCWPLWVIITY